MNTGDASATDEATLAAMGEALRAASHDIRQPVAAVLALVEAARLHPDATPGLQAYLDAILAQALQISETTRAVLDLDAVRPPHNVPVRLEEVLAEALEHFRLAWGGTLTRHVPRGVVQVRGDPGLLRRCIANVVENATRAAGPEGVVTVRLRRSRGQASVEVVDDGPGFGNIDAGSGIGLALTRRVMESVGGALVVGSGPVSGGARVALRMPLLDVDEEDACQAQAV
jgi:signal transduction histidine kinase